MNTQFCLEIFFFKCFITLKIFSLYCKIIIFLKKWKLLLVLVIISIDLVLISRYFNKKKIVYDM